MAFEWLRRVHVSFVIVSTFIVCCSHVMSITRLYFKYQTRTKLTIGFDEMIRIPTVAVCISTDWTGTNLTQFFEHYVQPDAEVMHSGYIAPPRSPDYTKFWFSEEKLSKSEVSEVFTRRSFSTGRKKCFSFKFFRTEIRRMIMTSLVQRMLYLLHYDKQQIMLDSFSYYLLSPDHNDTIIDSSSRLPTLTYWLTRPYPHYAIQFPHITYQRRKTQLLPAPHDTRCVDYRNAGLQSQLHCLHDCIKRESIRTLYLVPTDVSIFHLNETKVALISLEQMQNVSMTEKLSNIYNSCRVECPNPNCEDDHFKPFNPTMASRKANRNTSIASYQIFVPVWPDILIETGAAFSFVDYMMEMLNAISLWTAFCPMEMKDLRAEKIAFLYGTIAYARQTISFSKRTVKWLVPLLCLAACFYQLQESAVQFFAYKTVSKLSIQMETEKKAPALTLCNNLRYRMEKVSSNLTLAEHFLLFSNAHFLIIQSENNDGKTEHFLKNNEACNTFYPTSKPVITSNPRNTLYGVSLWNSSKYEQVGYHVSLHDVNHRIHGQYDSYTYLVVAEWSYITVFFTAFHNQYLPPPYETKCRDYSSTKFQSQEHCIESCAIRLSLDQRGVFPLFVSAAYDPLPVLFDHHFNLTTLLMLRQSCRSDCQNQDCQTTTFTSRTATADSDGTSPRIAVSGSTELSYKSESVAATDWVTFVTNFLGCIAFWTGVCPFGVLLSQQILSFFKRPALPPLSRRCYVCIIVMLSAAAYAYQVFTMADEYFKYGTTNTIMYQSHVEQEPFSLTICYEFPSNRTNELTKLNISNTFSLLEVRDQLRRIEEERLTLIHYKIFGLLCHSIRVDEKRDNISNTLTPARKPKFNDNAPLVAIEMTSFLWEKLVQERDEVYLSMANTDDKLYNPFNNFVLMTQVWSHCSSLEFKIIMKENMPAPYDTHCLHHVHGDRTISANDCFHSCYSSLIMQKYALFPFDSPRLLNAGNASFQFPSLGQANNITESEDEKRSCSKRCGNDCLQVNYYLRELTLPQDTELVLFIISGPDEEIRITHSAYISFLDLLSVMLNGASFYFTFCPATLLLSHWFWSFVTPAPVVTEYEPVGTEMDPICVNNQPEDPAKETKSSSARVSPEPEHEETEMHQLLAGSLQRSVDAEGMSAFVSKTIPSGSLTPDRVEPENEQQETGVLQLDADIQQADAAEESASLSNANVSVNHEYGQGQISIDPGER